MNKVFLLSDIIQSLLPIILIVLYLISLIDKLNLKPFQAMWLFFIYTFGSHRLKTTKEVREH
jgi:hypothetical protein